MMSFPAEAPSGSEKSSEEMVSLCFSHTQNREV